MSQINFKKIHDRLCRCMYHQLSQEESIRLIIFHLVPPWNRFDVVSIIVFIKYNW
jgi:hypothetical protein